MMFVLSCLILPMQLHAPSFALPGIHAVHNCVLHLLSSKQCVWAHLVTFAPDAYCISIPKQASVKSNAPFVCVCVSRRAQYNGFNPVTGEDYRPPVQHAHHVVSNPNAGADHDPLLQYGNASPDRSTIMTWKQPRPTPAEADVQARRVAQTGHIQDMRQDRIKSEGLSHTRSTAVRDLI